MTTSLQEIQDGVLEQLHAGEPLDRQALLRDHPEHGEALQAFLTLLDEIEQPLPLRQPPPSRLGDFRILSEIGRGGMGVVYEAEQVSLRRIVALKLLPPALQYDRKLVGRFRREAEAAGRLRHPNIVPVYSFGEVGGTPFFAMERVQGTSLAQIIEQRREGRSVSAPGGPDGGAPSDPDAFRRWALGAMASIADALHYAHGQGILHRDTKPANILIDEDGTPRLSDFGVALDLEAASLTASGEVLGSPQYMSPEQAFRKQRPLDARSDIYSLGVTLYELLTLRLPYAGTTSSEIMGCLHSGEVVPPSKVVEGFPASLESVLLRALAREPEQRYATADELAADLRAVRDDRSATNVRPPTRWLRRGLLAAAILAGVFIAVANLDEGGVMEQSVTSLLGGPAVMLPTHDDLERLLDGEHPAPHDLLAGWIAPSLSLRSLVARDAPAPLHLKVPVVNPSRVPDATLLLALAQVSLDQGPWRPVQPLAAQIDVRSGFGDGATHIMGSDLRALGPGALDAGGTSDGAQAGDVGSADALAGDAVGVRTRLLLRVLRVGDLPPPEVAITAEVMASLSAGSGAVLNLPDRTVLVYDHYPEDYPQRLSTPELDAAMSAAWTPTLLRFQRLSDQGEGGRSLLMTLEFGGAPDAPLTALASDVALYADDDEQPFARATCAEPTLRAGTTSHSTARFFELSDPPSPDEQRTLLDLAGGRLDSLRVVITPSRAAALAESELEAYWGGRVDVRVPVVLP